VSVSGIELEGVADDEVAVTGHRNAGVELCPVVGGDAEGAAEARAVGAVAGRALVAVTPVAISGPDNHAVAMCVHRHDSIVVVLTAAVDGDLLVELVADGNVCVAASVFVAGGGIVGIGGGVAP